MNIIEFEETLSMMRLAHYRHRQVDIFKDGFAPVGGRVADFCTIQHAGRHHFFYIERRLINGTPFYPGHEIYLGHASTADFFNWEVHDPILVIRPNTWEEAHLWAPAVLRLGDTFVLAYTGVNRHLSQDIGLAFSQDLFTWERSEYNPISPCRDRPWAYWRAEFIASCRDPHLLEHGGRMWMTYSVNTREGAPCIALTSTDDWRYWEDHGPILVGPKEGYEPRFEGGHPQAGFESSNLIRRGDQWYLQVMANVRGSPIKNWVVESNSMTSFDFSARRPFWPGAYTVEVIADRANRSLLACAGMSAYRTDGRPPDEGVLRLGEVDWSDEHPMGRFIATPEQLSYFKAPRSDFGDMEGTL